MMKQGQVSLTDQLWQLVAMADKNGLYDAADHIRRMLMPPSQNVPRHLMRCNRLTADEVARLFTDDVISALDKEGLNAVGFHVDDDAELIAVIRPPNTKGEADYPCVWYQGRWEPF